MRMMIPFPLPFPSLYLCLPFSSSYHCHSFIFLFLSLSLSFFLLSQSFLPLLYLFSFNPLFLSFPLHFHFSSLLFSLSLSPTSSKRLGLKGADQVKAHPFFVTDQWNWDNIRSTVAYVIPELKSEIDTTYFDDIEDSSTQTQSFSQPMVSKRFSLYYTCTCTRENFSLASGDNCFWLYKVTTPPILIRAASNLVYS